MRVPYSQALHQIENLFLQLGFHAPRAALLARLFVDASAEGVPSHGINRVPRFVRTLRLGLIRPNAEPVRVAGMGALERWDGKRGPGPLNAHACMQRAMELARAHGVGCVALAHTNHWMRGGAYGKLAAEAGFVGMCWTNTFTNMPAWAGAGPTEPLVGNNPLVIAAPRAGGVVLLDMAMAQFSFGQLDNYRRRGELLPFDGGYDAEGHLTRDAAKITRTLPIGLWKGAGLATVLDLLAAMLSDGSASHQIARDPDAESDVSQVFIAIAAAALGTEEERERTTEAVLASVQGQGARYPGQHLQQVREASLREGVAVPDDIWNEILAIRA